MSFNGSGTFLINTAGQPVVAGTVISSTAFNALTADLATGLSTVITKDGQTTVTANIPMSTYKFTGLGVGSAATDSANLSQVQSTVTKLLTSVSGADTITAVGAPVVAAYAAGQMFYFVATGDNTGAVTLNIDALGAKAVTRDGSVALAAGDIKSGEVVVVVYDGTRFQVVSQLNSAGDARFANVSIASSLYVGGVSTFVGNAGFSANVSIASALSVGGVAAITGATTIGGNLTLSGGTANGVLYLNGSKVATSGSALTFDGTDLATTGGVRLNNAQYYYGKNAAGSAVRLLGVNSGNVNYIGAIDSGPTEVNYGAASTITAQYWNISGTEAMRLTSTGLGIGTSSPGTILDLGTSTGQKISVYRNANIRYGFGIETDTMRYYVPTGASNAVHSFGAISTTDGTTYTERLRLDSSGNLGLGVTPSAWSIRALQVGSGFAAWSTAVTNARIFANTYYDGAYKYVGTGRATQYEQDGYHAWYTSASGTAGNTISWTQAMTLSAAGDLGVGTTSPGARLDVGYTAGNVALRVSRDSSNRLDFYQGAGVSYIDSSPAGGVLAFATVGTERARITSDGYSKFSNDGTYFGSTSAYHEMRQTAADTCVVLNATNASFASDVIFARTTRAANSAYNFFTGNANGTDQVRLRGDGVIYAQNTSVQSISDARLKENIRNATEGLNVITALRPVRYDWKSGYGNNRKDQLGFIAQEIEAVFPEAVSEWQISNSDQEAYKTVGPGALIPVLVKAIQEQQAMIKSLEAKVAALESK